MNLRFGTRLTPVILVVALAAASAFAKDQRNLTLQHPVSVNGTAIQAGNYKVAWSAASGDPTVTFVKGKQTVASAQAKWVDRNIKPASDEVLYSTDGDGSRKIVEIRFAGMNQALVFSDSAS